MVDQELACTHWGDGTLTIRTVTIALLTLALTGASVVGIRLLAQGTHRVPAMVQVVISRQALERGTVLQPDMVELKAWPDDLLLDGMLTSLDELPDRIVLTPIVAGEPLLDDKLALPGVGPSIASLIPQGMRAITIPTPTVASSVAGFVLPGNRVDVLLTLGQTGSRNASEVLTVTVAQNVEILAIDQKTRLPRENHIDLKEMQSVTLLTTLKQASRLQLGQSRGSLHLILRHPEDELIPEPYHACLSELQGDTEEAGKDLETSLLASADSIFAKHGRAIGPERASDANVLEKSIEPPTLQQRFVRTMRGSQAGRVSFEPYFSSSGDLTAMTPEQPAEAQEPRP